MRLASSRQRQRNAPATRAAIHSAATVAAQMPSTCQNSGRMSTGATWNSRVRKKEMTADTRPLFSAVKNAEPKMAKPVKRKEKANMPKARTVSS